MLPTPRKVERFESVAKIGELKTAKESAFETIEIWLLGELVGEQEINLYA